MVTVVVYTYSALTALSLLMGWQNKYHEPYQDLNQLIPGSYMAYTFVAPFFVAMVLTTVLYCKILHVAKQKSLQIAQLQIGTVPQSTGVKAWFVKIGERKGILILILVQAYFVLSWLQLVLSICILYDGFTSNYQKQWTYATFKINTICAMITGTNSVLGPWLYGFLKKSIRKKAWSDLVKFYNFFQKTACLKT